MSPAHRIRARMVRYMRILAGERTIVCDASSWFDADVFCTSVQLAASFEQVHVAVSRPEQHGKRWRAYARVVG